MNNLHFNQVFAAEVHITSLLLAFHKISFSSHDGISETSWCLAVILLLPFSGMSPQHGLINWCFFKIRLGVSL